MSAPPFHPAVVYVVGAAVIVVLAWSLIGTILSLSVGHALLIGLGCWMAYSVGRCAGRKAVEETPRRRVKARRKVEVLK
jgi:membrane protein DedA with SNARE-associated domain